MKFSNSVPKVFIATPIDVVVFKFRNKKLSDRKSVKSCVIYLTEKNCLPLKLSLLSGLRPKSATASPEQCIQSFPDFIQIGSLSAEL